MQKTVAVGIFFLYYYTKTPPKNGLHDRDTGLDQVWGGGGGGGLSMDFKLHQQVELVRNTQLNLL